MRSREMNSLLEKYLAGQATAEEEALVEEWYQSFETKPGITEQLNDEEKEMSLTESFDRIRNALKFN